MSSHSLLEQFHNSSPYKAPFKTSWNGPLALFLLLWTLLLSVVATGIGHSTVFKSVNFIFFSLLISLSLGFAIIFLSNYFGVYV